MRRALILAILACALASCGADPTPPPTPRILPLTTIELPPNAACAGVGLATVIHGDPDDPDVVWLGGFPAAGDHRKVVFPAGYRAVFDPGLEIVDGAGRVQMREGDFVDGACGQPVPDHWLLAPPFPAFRLECGPLAIPECTTSRVYQAGLQAAGANRPIARIRFLDATGKFEALFEDGTTMTGFASSN
ncbi:MAG TPA: hypothetical protein VN773_01855 [Verrucomicrobiae bacterium]|jgi:hypothetical protein|nr:hypothetical protein [Verrucomicrobiae bacterium]